MKKKTHFNIERIFRIKIKNVVVIFEGKNTLEHRTNFFKIEKKFTKQL